MRTNKTKIVTGLFAGLLGLTGILSAQITIGSTGCNGTAGSLLYTDATYVQAITPVGAGYLLGSQGTLTPPSWLQAATLNTSLTTPTIYGGSSTSSSLSLYQSSASATSGSFNLYMGAGILSAYINLGTAPLSGPATLFGYQGMAGGGDVAIGYYANWGGRANGPNGGDNTAVGYQAIAGGLHSQYNTAVGYRSQYAVNTGLSNSALGLETGYNNQSGSYNVSVGDFSLWTSTNSSNNIGIGIYTLYYTTTSNNTGVGRSALYSSTTGTSLTALGNYSGINNTAGSFNVFIGDSSGIANTSGYNNTFLGYNSNISSGTYHNATAIGANATVGASNSLILGSGANVGIGTTTPNSLLHVSGAAQLGDATSSGSLTFYNSTVPSYYTTFQPSASATAAQTYTLPTAYPSTSGYALTSTTGGTLSWAAVSGGVTGPTGPAGGWALTGNSGTTPGTNFIGTTDSEDLIFKVNNQVSGVINMAYESTFLGYECGNYASNTGVFNNALGWLALYSNTSGTANTAIGSMALYSNTSGSDNTAIGYNALVYNTSGGDNQAFGQNALRANNGSGNFAAGIYALGENYTGNSNIAIGSEALFHNYGGSNNIGFGDAALITNTSGYDNIAIGYQALQVSSTAIGNIAIGVSALTSATTGSLNTAIGANSGYGNTTGDYNVFIGDVTLSGGPGFDYSTAIGYGSITTGSNNIYLGNSTTYGVYDYTGVFTASDGRFKTNVNTITSGLAFIKKLRPVTYNLDTKSMDDYITQNMPDSLKVLRQKNMPFASSSAFVHSGFIAQEVAQAASGSGFTSSIVHVPTNNKETYALNYAEIVVPLVRAVQEQQVMIDSLIYLTNALQNQINSCCSSGQQNMKLNNNSSLAGSNSSGAVVSSDALSVNGISTTNSLAILYQNAPNPFNQQTSIGYFVPTSSQIASIMIFDLQGKLVLTVPVSNYGNGSIIINGNQLNPGMFVYSLLVDGKIIDTKRMILTQ